MNVVVRVLDAIPILRSPYRVCYNSVPNSECSICCCGMKAKYWFIKLYMESSEAPLVLYGNLSSYIHVHCMYACTGTGMLSACSNRLPTNKPADITFEGIHTPEHRYMYNAESRLVAYGLQVRTHTKKVDSDPAFWLMLIMWYSALHYSYCTVYVCVCAFSRELYIVATDTHAHVHVLNVSSMWHLKCGISYTCTCSVIGSSSSPKWIELHCVTSQASNLLIQVH